MILIADEPTGNLDPNTAAEIMMILEEINDNGTTVIMATHDSNIVDTMRRRVISMSSGEIISDNKKGGYSLEA